MAQFKQDFESLAQSDIHTLALARKEDGWRYVQTLAVNTEQGIDLVYSYMLDGHLCNSVVSAVQKEDTIPSISDVFLEAFVFENEIHDLFGVKIENIAIDFLGNFYQLSTETPMTVISAAQLAAREKAAKIAAAKAAKEAGDTKKPTTDTSEADLEAKLSGMDPEKAAKVRAAMEAKAKKEAAAQKEGE